MARFEVGPATGSGPGSSHGFGPGSETVRIRFDDFEVALLRDLARVLTILLATDSAGSGGASPDPLAVLVGMDDAVTAPDSPVLSRLLPDAYRDDPDAAGEFRRYTQTDLQRGKRDDLAMLVEDLPMPVPVPGADGSGPAADVTSAGAEPAEVVVELDRARGWSWLRALNDMRLALGTSLGITDDGDLLAARDDPRAALIDTYDWLTWLQGTLVEALTAAP
jgi:hypothetical protein